MKKIFSLSGTIVFLLISIFLLATCTKDYSYEGGPMASGGATGKSFTLLGAGSTCTGSILAGNYYVGTALTAANIIQLQVHVDSIGSYSISTATIDGFQFTGSGNFTDTGVQTITLKGVGTPTAEGSFPFTTPVGLGCTFTVTITQMPTAVAAYTLEGDPNLCPGVDIAGSYVYGYKLTTTNYATVVVNVMSIGAYAITTDTVDGFSFSAAGTFTKVGLQTVSLIGSGTPLSPGYVTFTPKGNGSSCKFTVPVINPYPLATYVLESGFGAPSPCIYTVAGNYTSKTPLSATNTVSISTYATIAGNFTIATNIVNGISFSYTGTFTSLGQQRIVLFGSGTPLAAGTFGFVPQIVGPAPLGGASCAFSVAVQ